uniref:Uncharacterized protein n=1 Tax=Arundo donax TaxID=35708 RepID=A0A0A9CEI8_ARUDO
MEIVDSVSILNSPGNAASVNCKVMKTQSRKSIHKEASNLTIPCVPLKCNQFRGVQCPNDVTDHYST